MPAITPLRDGRQNSLYLSQGDRVCLTCVPSSLTYEQPIVQHLVQTMDILRTILGSLRDILTIDMNLKKRFDIFTFNTLDANAILDIPDQIQYLIVAPEDLPKRKGLV